MKRTVHQFVIDYERKHGQRLTPAIVRSWIHEGHLNAFMINNHHYEIHGGLNVKPKTRKRWPKKI